MNKMFIKIMIVCAAIIIAKPTLFVLADQPAQLGKPYKLPPNLKKYFSDKYAVDDISSTIQETSDGPRGSIHLSGKIKPSKIDMATILNEPNADTVARNMSKALIDEEADTLGISKDEEVREEKVFSEQGYDGSYTHIWYLRYINGLLLNNAYIKITIGPSKEIEDFSAELVPIPSELVDASKKNTLTEDKIIKLVENDLGVRGKEKKILKVERISKYLETKSPYLFYGITVKLADKSGTRMSFKLNAQTGEVITSKVIRYTNKQ